MLELIVAKIKGFLLNPVETFRSSREDTSGTVLAYFSALLVLDAVLTSAVTVLGIGFLGAFGQYLPHAGPFLPVVIFLLVLVGGLVWALIISAWIHLWVFIFGGRKGIFQTVKAVLYGLTPSLLFGWIPVIGFFFTLWAIVLEILGIRELQEISSGKAILVLFIAVMIPIFLLIVLALYLMVNVHSIQTTQVVSSAPV
ncbi:YIP1 family protein [Methanoregula sp.]|uniref:YIP1 family protein n=1 Tax=Methanoregula sp. TaxID=2052170 RepID=UPI0035682F27